MLEARVAALQSPTMPRRCCPGGQEKRSELSVIKIDAAQPFKPTSLVRGLLRVLEMLDRVASSHGCDAVAVRKSARVAGHLCKSTKGSDALHRVFSFQDIRSTLNFIS